MLDKIDLPVDDIKDTFKKHSLDMDHFWNEIKRMYNFNSAGKASGRTKRSGVSIDLLFEIGLIFPIFLQRSVRALFSGHLSRILACNKSAFYRFYQDDFFNWRRVIYNFNRQIENRNKSAEEKKYPAVLILDDSPLPKSGRRIEGATRLHDHASGKFIIGFKLLGLCWFDGNFSRFLDFSLVGEKKIKFKRNKQQFKKDRDPASAVAKRKKELKNDKVSLSCDMISRAVKHGFIPEFVLTDTWFTCAEIINKIRSLAKSKIHFLGMVKHGTRKYTYNCKDYTLNELRKHCSGNIKRCRKFNSRYITVNCYLKNVGNIKIFFSRYHGRKKWVAILTTKTDINYIRAIEVYSIRWNIEVGFKEMKQLLELGKCHANDFSAQIAHTSCVFIAHAFLADCKSYENYKSMGILFEKFNEEYTNLLTMDKLMALFEFILISIGEQLGGIKNITIEELLHSAEYEIFKDSLKRSIAFGAVFGKGNLSLNNKEDIAQEAKVAS